MIFLGRCIALPDLSALQLRCGICSARPLSLCRRWTPAAAALLLSHSLAAVSAQGTHGGACLHPATCNDMFQSSVCPVLCVFVRTVGWARCSGIMKRTTHRRNPRLTTVLLAGDCATVACTCFQSSLVYCTVKTNVPRPQTNMSICTPAFLRARLIVLSSGGMPYATLPNCS